VSNKVPCTYHRQIKYNSPQNMLSWIINKNLSSNPKRTCISPLKIQQWKSWVYCDNSVMKILLAETLLLVYVFRQYILLLEMNIWEACCVSHIAILLCRSLISLSEHSEWLYFMLRIILPVVSGYVVWCGKCVLVPI